MQRCSACRDDEPLGFDFQMAFQPIVSVRANRIWGFEALVRGAGGEGAESVLGKISHTNRYKFDQACRVKAIESAAKLFDRADLRLSINFMPNAVYEPAACIRATLDAARRTGFNRSMLMFEFTENEPMRDTDHVSRIIAAYKELGFLTALDDFGAGYAGLGLLARIQPDLIKIDMELLRGVDASAPRRAIVGGVVGIAQQLGVQVLAEGVETSSEARTLLDLGIDLLQGYFIGKPLLGALPPSDTIRLPL